MKRKMICTLLVIAMLAIVLVGCSTDNGVQHEIGQNLVSNSTFEDNQADWEIITSAEKMPTFTKVAVGGSAYDPKRGQTYLEITEFESGSYTMAQQTIAVEKHTVYCFTADYNITKAVSVNSNGLGAYIQLKNFEFVADSETDATSGWRTFTVYFDSDSFDEVTLSVGLGTKQYVATAGTVCFDNVTLYKVDPALVTTSGGIKSVENGTYIVHNLSSGNVVNYRDAYRSSTQDIIFMVLVTVLSAALMVCAYFFMRRLVTPKEQVVLSGGVVKGSNIMQNQVVLLSISLVVAFAIRLVLALTIYGYGAYQNALMTNAVAMAENGLWHYYFDSTAYAPGTMYLLYIIGLLAGPLKLTAATQGFAIFIKIPAILADLLTVFFVFNALKEKGNVYAFTASILLALCPVFFMASGVWSAYASLGILFLVLAALALRDRGIIKFTVFYTLAVLFMPEALLLLPLLLTFGVYMYVKYPELRVKLPLCATIAVIAGYAVSVPLSIDWFTAAHPFIVLENYVSYFSGEQFFAHNIFNLYGMCGVAANTVNTTGNVFSAIFAALAMLSGIGLYLKRRNRQDVLLMMGWTLGAIYMLCVRMNIWVMLTSLVLLFVYAAYTQEKRLLWISGAYSVLGTVNLCYVMLIGANVKGGAGAMGVTVGSLDPVMILFSVLAFLTFAAFTYVTIDVCLTRKKLLMPLTSDKEEQEVA